MGFTKRIISLETVFILYSCNLFCFRVFDFYLIIGIFLLVGLFILILETGSYHIILADLQLVL